MMGRHYFTADLHFGHKNIIALEDRPFEDVAHMDRAMIAYWNDIVESNDTVFVLGDYGFYGRDKTRDITNSLRGKKILIRGNHDTHSAKWYTGCGFHAVYDYPIIYNGWFVLSHEPPTYFNNNTPYFYIFGHVHATKLYPTAIKNAACVSVERWGFRPVTLDEIITKINATTR